MIPYLALQLKGLGIIVSQTSDGSVSSTAAVWIGAFVLSVYVVASGIHGSAWTAAIKDVLTLSVVDLHRALPADPLLRLDRRDVPSRGGGQARASPRSRATS